MTSAPMAKPVAPSQLARMLLDWYDRHRRRLPWRAAPGVPSDPYRVWLSEIMLQQTTVPVVVGYFQRFLARWPTLEALTQAELDDVLHAWQGLGYYARARNLHACAQQVLADHGGRFPPEERALRALPGIGRYTAAAIAAIAFDRPATVVDGNVERVMARLRAIETPLPAAKPRLYTLAAELTPETRPGDYAQALMDLGATVCTPRNPGCLACPWRNACEGRARGMAETLPHRAPKRPRPLRHGVSFWLMRADGAVLLRRRPEMGLLGGMIELPTSPWRAEPWTLAEATAHAPEERQWQALPEPVRHGFTHFEIELTVAAAETDGDGDPGDIWCPPARFSDYALPALTRKLVRYASRHQPGPARGIVGRPAAERSIEHGSIAAITLGARRSDGVTAGDRRAGGNKSARLSPTRVREAMRRAALYARTGRLGEARELYRTVLTARPDHGEALKAAALVAFRLDAVDEAAALLHRAVALDAGDAGAHNDLGNVLQVAGRLDAALTAYRRAVELDPERAETHVNLGQALRAKGDLDGATEALGRAAVLRPNHAGTVLRIGLVHHAKGDLDEAASAFRQVLAIEPENAEACFALGNVLYAQGRLDEAVVAYGQAATLRVDILDASFEVGKPRHVHAYFDRGEPRAALKACDDLLARQPGQSGALAMKAVALWEAGEKDQARSLLDFDRLLRQEHSAPPANFADISAFNAALAAHVRNHPTLQAAPESYSMERGQSTGELLPGRGPAAAFGALVAQAANRYRTAMPQASSHPFLADIPDRVRITAWGVILDEGAYQVPHIHPSAWLSGVYYVALPSSLGADDDGTAGWIEFGRPYWDFQIRAEPETRLIEPEEGLMLLFPSYMFHRTLPFTGSGERISIAFDVLRGE